MSIPLRVAALQNRSGSALFTFAGLLSLTLTGFLTGCNRSGANQFSAAPWDQFVNSTDEQDVEAGPGIGSIEKGAILCLEPAQWEAKSGIPEQTIRRLTNDDWLPPAFVFASKPTPTLEENPVAMRTPHLEAAELQILQAGDPRCEKVPGAFFARLTVRGLSGGASANPTRPAYKLALTLWQPHAGRDAQGQRPWRAHVLYDRGGKSPPTMRLTTDLERLREQFFYRSKASLRAFGSRPALLLGDPGLWTNDADYPAAARLARGAGIIGFTLSVSAEGKVTDCKISHSSGSATLDAATCSLLIKNARLFPALDQGRPVAGHYSNRFRWSLPD